MRGRNALRVARLFAREWLYQPAAVGAICPSSQQLARKIARQLPAGDGLVIELGGGTGVVTQALLEHGVSAERLIVVERSAAFAAHLRQRFPNVNVIQGDATCLEQLLPVGTRAMAIVSCLPLRSLPPSQTAAILEQCARVIDEQGVVIQFTYSAWPWTRRRVYRSEFVVHKSCMVWANLPPARVMTARKTAS